MGGAVWTGPGEGVTLAGLGQVLVPNADALGTRHSACLGLLTACAPPHVSGLREAQVPYVYRDFSEEEEDACWAPGGNSRKVK